MTGTILQVYQDNNGRLYFRSDLPVEMDAEERVSLIRKIRTAMKTGQVGSLETAVSACIRQLALGAALCQEDEEALKRDFRADVYRLLKLFQQAGE